MATNNAAQDPAIVVELVGLIYEAALDPSRWERFLERLGTVLHAPVRAIFGNDFTQRSVDIEGGSGAFTTAQGIDDSMLDSFARHYCQTNVWLHHNPKLHQPGTVVHNAMLFPDSRLPTTEWYADWLKPQDLFHGCGAVVERSEDRSFNVTVVRPRRLGAYTTEELRLLGQLMPHLQTAFALHRRLHRTQALLGASLTVLEDLPLGVVLLDERAKVLHATARARGLIQRTRLLHLKGQDRVHASAATDDQWLQRAMRECVATGRRHGAAPGEARRLHGLHGTQLHVMVAPLPRQASPYGVHGAAMVLLTDPALTIPSLAELLRSVYRLTPAEAVLAQALVNGLTLREFADRQGLSFHTVRTQFKSAAHKVGVGRQADFVRVVLTGPALLRQAHGATAP